MILIFFAGWGIVSFLATGNSFIQHTVPDSLRGRVMSFYALVFLGFMPLGNALIGLAADFWGVIVSLKIFAIVCILGSIIFLKFFRRSH
jgi:MFS family permease